MHGLTAIEKSSERSRAMLVRIGAALAVVAIPSAAPAQYLTVYGGPTYDAAARTGYQHAGMSGLPFVYGSSSAGNGVGVGFADRYSGGAYVGQRAIRWDASGGAVELPNLGTDSNGVTSSGAFAVNAVGAVVGWAHRNAGSIDLGSRAVRWDAATGAVTELANLGTDSSGYASSQAKAVNALGTAIGWAEKYTGAGTFLGPRAVRWDASGTAATELGNLGTDSTGNTLSRAQSVNSAGVAVGYSDKYNGGTYLGSPAVRWNASTSAATEMGNLGTGSNGPAGGEAFAINDAGTAVGVAIKDLNGTTIGSRAVRWDASGAATELGTLSAGSNSFTNAEAVAINNAGTAVGQARKFPGAAYRAVRWDASGTAATELGNIFPDSVTSVTSGASAINALGAAVGYSYGTSGGTYTAHHAVLWNPAGNTFDLSALIDPNSGWTLSNAAGISDTNWVSGVGSFDPDGAGPLQPYDRAFLLNVSSIIPEPEGIAALIVMAIALPHRPVRWRTRGSSGTGGGAIGRGPTRSR